MMYCKKKLFQKAFNPAYFLLYINVDVLYIKQINVIED